MSPTNESSNRSLPRAAAPTKTKTRKVKTNTTTKRDHKTRWSTTTGCGKTYDVLAKHHELVPTGWMGISSQPDSQLAGGFIHQFHSSVGSADGRYVHSVDPRDVGLGPVLLFLILGVLEEDEAEAALQVDPVDGDGGGAVVGDRVGENFLHVAHVDGVAEVAEEDGPVRSR